MRRTGCFKRGQKTYFEFESGPGVKDLKTPMTKIALVTGAEGFIGSNMVRFLHAKGWHVGGTYRQERQIPFAKLPNVDFVQCDLRNGQRATKVLAQYQPTRIFHFGAQSLPTVSWAEPQRRFFFTPPIVLSSFCFWWVFCA